MQHCHNVGLCRLWSAEEEGPVVHTCYRLGCKLHGVLYVTVTIAWLIVLRCVQLLLSSDEAAFGGFENLSKKYNTEFASTPGDYDGRPNSIKVLLACNALVTS